MHGRLLGALRLSRLGIVVAIFISRGGSSFSFGRIRACKKPTPRAEVGVGEVSNRRGDGEIVWWFFTFFDNVQRASSARSFATALLHHCSIV